MEISEQNLASFSAWIVARGRSPDTAALYATHLRTAAADPKGLTHRLVARKLAPNTVHGIMAALRAWALYTEDGALSKQLSDIRLPPARRVRHKAPLDLETWRGVVQHLGKCRMTCDPLRQVLLLMALRGFRSGDILRLRRTEIVRALDTGKLVYEGKGRKRLEFAVEPIRAPLECLVKETGWVSVRDLVTTSKNPKVASVKVWRASRRTAKKAGVLEMNPHRYRHTFATNFLKQLQGDPNAIVKLQKYMGWENMATAARYVNTIEQDELDVVGAGLVELLKKR